MSFPPLDWDQSPNGDIVTEYLQSAGWTGRGGMGGGLSWPELAAWRDACCFEPTPWEMEALQICSGVYASMLHQSEDPMEPGVWFNREDAARNAEQTLKRVKAASGALVTQGE